MKPTLLALSFLTLLATAKAQSSFRILSSGNKILNNTTLYVNQDTASLYTGTFNVQNTGNATLTSKLRKEEISMSAGSSSSICYSGNCCPASVYTTKCYPHTAGGLNLMNADFTYGKTYNTSSVRYTVYNCADPNDTASFVIVYIASPSGIPSQYLDYSIGAPYPNPASSVLNIDYKFSNSHQARIRIYDLLGSLLRNIDLSQSSGTLTVNTSDLKAGLYFYTLELGQHAVSTGKFLVNH